MAWRQRDSLCVFIWLAFLVVGVRGHTSDGENYIIACTNFRSTEIVTCTLLIQGSEGTSITIKGSGVGYPRTETITEALEISIVIQEMSLTAIILTVTTTGVVSIFVQNEASGLITSSYLALALDEDLNAPYTGADMENAFVSFPASSPEHNLYIVGSAYAGTVVTIALVSTGPVRVQGVTRNSGDSIPVFVDALQSIEITTGEDLSGSLLTSNKPIGVFSGSIIGETLEQIPSLSKWTMPTPVPRMDICNSITILAAVSQAGSLQMNENDFLLTVDLLKAGVYHHQPNKTTIVQGLRSLVGLQCRIGVNNKPLFLTLVTSSQAATEFKCYIFSGFVNTMYIIAFKTGPLSYDINGESFNFTVVDTYTASVVSTYKGSAPDGFFVIKAYDSFPFLPYVTGVTADGSRTYAHACAKGSLGPFLPGDVTSTLDQVSASLLMTSSNIESSGDVTLSSSMDTTPTATLQDSSSFLESMEYSTPLDPASSFMDLESLSGMSSDTVSSSTQAINSSSATADASFMSTAQVADSSASPFISTMATPSTDVSLATSSSPLASSTKNAVVTSSVVASSSNIKVPSSATASTSNNAVSSSVPVSTNYNAISSSVPVTTSNNAISSSVPVSTSNNAISSSVPVTTSNNAISSSVPVSTSNNAISSSVPVSTSNNAISSSIPVSTSNNAISSSIPVSTNYNAISSSVPVSTSNNGMSSSSVVSASPTGTTMTSSVSATSVQTTAPATVTDNTTGGLQEVCLCRCGEMLILPNETQQFLEQYDLEIKINLTLDAKTLSAYIRAKTSAQDERPSAQNFGYLGICLLTITFGVLILSDILNICKIIISKKK